MRDRGRPLRSAARARVPRAPAPRDGRLRRTWLPLLSAGGVGLQVCPIVVELELQPEGTLRQALGQVASFQRAVRENDDRVVGVPTRADLEPVERGERLGLVMALEGVEPFGYDVWPADLFWELGLRVVSLTWNRRTRTPTVRPRAAAFLGSAVRCSDGDERVSLAGDWTKRLAELAPLRALPTASHRRGSSRARPSRVWPAPKTIRRSSRRSRRVGGRTSGSTASSRATCSGCCARHSPGASDATKHGAG